MELTLYIDNLEDSDKLLEIIGTEEIKEYIDNASLETVKAILTSYIRWHCWNYDIWNEIARMGIFYKLLTRIKNIAD